MPRIVHISDLHAGRPSTAERVDLETVVEALLRDVSDAASQRPVDLLIMSGDLAFSGQREEFELAKRTLLDPLEEALGLTRERIVLVPGNHDVNRDEIDPDLEAGYQANLTSREALNAFLADASRVERASARLGNWSAFQKAYHDVSALKHVPPFGFVHELRLDDVRTSVAALNTAWRSAGDGDEGKLLLGDQQVRAALRELEGAPLPILVFHHPFAWLAKWDGDEVRRLAAAGKVLLLTGHDHVADPTFETTVRGTILHSRGACLYDSFSYRNGYSVIDVDVQARRTAVRLRNWYRERREFDAAVDIVKEGVLPLDWPTISTEVVIRPDVSFSDVMSNLAEIVQQRSIISDYLDESGRERQVDDVLVAPRLWPLRYREAVAIAARGGEKTSQVDNRELLSTADVVVVAGEPESGVTGTLLWLLAHRYDAGETQLPVYVPFDSRFKDTRFERWLRRELGRYGVTVSPGEPLPPLIIAVDDVAPAHSGALGAFVRFVRENPRHSFILGTHGDVHEELERTFREADVGVRVAHLGPFGRRELRSFVEKITGAPSDELVERVTKILRSERLPRNPFIITALVTVIVKHIELAEVNESSLLDAYVSFLLGQGEAYDRAGLDMDHRRREHLLEMFALSLIEDDRLSVPRMAFEEFVLRYFRERDWGERLSAGKVADDLIARRVLLESQDGEVGFRHPAFRALFAGKAMLDNKVFAAKLIDDPLANEAAIRHAAGLKRSDPELLRSFAGSTRIVMSKAANGFRVEMFDWIKSKPGWSNEHPDVEQLIERLDVPLPDPPAEEELDEQVDSYHDNLDFREPDTTERHPVDIAWAVAVALGRVLRNSELVDDVQLKTEVLKSTLNDWGTFAVMAAVREDQEGAIAAELNERMAGSVDSEAIARVVDLVIVFVTAMVVQSTLSTVHLEGTLKRVLADDEFMQSTVHALLATMLYAGTGAADWPDRFGELYEQHSEHPVVAELARTYALVAYRFGGLSEGEMTKLEVLLADIYAGEPIGGTGHAKALARSEQRTRAIEGLRRQRLIDRGRGGGSGPGAFDEILEADDDAIAEENDPIAG